MKMKIKGPTTCALTLTYEEACWLKALLHGSSHCCNSKKDRKMYKAFWQALCLFEKADVLVAGL